MIQKNIVVLIGFSILLLFGFYSKSDELIVCQSLINRESSNWLISKSRCETDNQYCIWQLSKDEAKQIKTIKLCGDNFYNRLPIKGADFPNLETLEFHNMQEIISFKGIAEFKKLKNVNIFIDTYNFDFIESFGFFKILDLNSLWEATSIESLTIMPKVIINDTNFTKLKNLKHLKFNSFYLPVFLLARLPNLESLEFPYNYWNLPENIQKFILYKLTSNRKTHIMGDIDYSGRFSLYKDDFPYDNINTYTGEFKIYYKDGNIALRGNLKKGWPDGKWEYYTFGGIGANCIDIYDNGKLVSRDYIGVVDINGNRSYDKIKINETKNFNSILLTSHFEDTLFISKIKTDNGNLITTSSKGNIELIDISKHLKYKLKKDNPKTKKSNLIKETYLFYESPTSYRSSEFVLRTNLTLKNDYTIDADNQYDSFCINYSKQLRYAHEKGYDSLQNIINKYYPIIFK